MILQCLIYGRNTPFSTLVTWLQPSNRKIPTSSNLMYEIQCASVVFALCICDLRMGKSRRSSSTRITLCPERSSLNGCPLPPIPTLKQAIVRSFV